MTEIKILTGETSRQIVNGEPIIIAPYTNTIKQLQPAITLGTGFESWDQLEQELEHAIIEGEPTRHITPHNAKDLHRQYTENDCKKYDIFTLEATLNTQQE